MDKYTDIIITIACIAIWLISVIKKQKKKEAQKAKQYNNHETQIEHNEPTDTPVFEENTQYSQGDFAREEMATEKYFQSAESNIEKFPKTETYFTYDEVKPEESNLENETDKSDFPINKTKVQNIEKEEENTNGMLLNNEEIKKAIIYSEVLQKPNY